MGKAMLVVLLLMAAKGVAQPTNDQVCLQLLKEFLQTQGDTFHSVDTGSFPLPLPPCHLDTAAMQSLILSEPEVLYQQAGKKRFTRTLTLGLTLHDSTYRQQVLSYSDTLSLAELRYVRRRSPAGLKGDAPTFFARVIRPVAVIALSVAGVVSLFYLRSR